MSALRRLVTGCHGSGSSIKSLVVPERDNVRARQGRVDRLAAFADRPNGVIFMDDAPVRAIAIASPVSDVLIASQCIRGATVPTACKRNALMPMSEPETKGRPDDLATRHSRQIVEALRAYRCRFLCLQPYSPGPNPIEMMPLPPVPLIPPTPSQSSRQPLLAAGPRATSPARKRTRPPPRRRRDLHSAEARCRKPCNRLPPSTHPEVAR